MCAKLKNLQLLWSTESTVWSSYYEFKRNGFNLSYNGYLIGKALNETEIIIIDQNNKMSYE